MASKSPQDIDALSLEYIMEGRPYAAQDSPLFKLPLEILDQIFTYLDVGSPRQPDLASLALVNSDCRQIARARQFKSVHLWSFQCARPGLVALLLEEASLREQNPLGLTPSPSLGVCIRRLIVHQEPGRVESSALPILRSLPHLDSSVSYGHYSQRYLDTLVRSTARHVELRLTLTTDMPCARGPWPIQHLELDMLYVPNQPMRLEPPQALNFTDPQIHRLDASQYFSNMLQACASTLRSLTLRYNTELYYAENNSNSQREHLFTPKAFTPQLPALEYLDLTQFRPIGGLDQSAIRSLVSTSHLLKTLIINVDTRVSHDVLMMAGCIPSLQTLVLEDKDPAGNQPFIQFVFEGLPELQHIISQFLRRNPQLKVFQCRRGFRPVDLQPILEALQASHLKRLCLICNANDMPERCLSALTQITSLEDLWIECIYFGDDELWDPNPDALADSLRALQNLKRLSLPGLDADYIYDVDGDITMDMRQLQMRIQGAKYAQIFPRLERVNIQNLSFHIHRHVNNPARVTVFERPGYRTCRRTSRWKHTMNEPWRKVNPYFDPISDLYRDESHIHLPEEICVVSPASLGYSSKAGSFSTHWVNTEGEWISCRCSVDGVCRHVDCDTWSGEDCNTSSEEDCDTSSEEDCHTSSEEVCDTSSADQRDEALCGEELSLSPLYFCVLALGNLFFLLFSLHFCVLDLWYLFFLFPGTWASIYLACIHWMPSVATNPQTTMSKVWIQL